MGYHVTILRTNNGEQLPVSLNEAVAGIDGLEEWRYHESSKTFDFQGHNGSFSLQYQDGELWTKNPEEWQLSEMVTLAAKLNARVRGDEWETYDSSGNAYEHPDDVSLRKQAKAQSQEMLASSIKEHKFIRNGIIGIFVVLGVIAYSIGKWLEGM